MEEACGNENVLCLACIQVNIPFVVLYYGFARCYHWGKLTQDYMGSHCIISYSYVCIYNYLKMKSLVFFLKEALPFRDT